ncbi:MAG: hypothetical protein MI748_15285 [Opitutales bacterium]|nr:hypothetical protein [Opitutales bacterium]
MLTAQRSGPPNFTPPPLPDELSDEQRFTPGLNPSDEFPELVLVDEPFSQVFRLLEELTGKMVLQGSNISNTTIINFNSNGVLTRKEAVLAIESLLALNGVSITSMGEKFIKAIPTSSIRFSSPDLIEGSTLAMHPSQRLYMKVYELKHVLVDEVTQIVNALITPGLSTMQVFKKNNTVLVADNLSNLQQIERLINRVDVPIEMDSEMIFRTLYYISSEELKERLDRMAQGALGRFLNGETYFEADERTNQIIILTNPNNVPILDQVISSLDVDAAPLTKTEAFYLKHAQAVDVAGLLNSMISGVDTGGRNSNSNTPNDRGAQPPPNANVSNTRRVSGESSNSDQFSPFITIEADERSNAIIAFGTDSDIRYISNLIDKVDVMLAQVKIDVIIAEVNIGGQHNRGIDSFGLNIDDADEITIGLNQLVDSAGAFAGASDLPFRIGSTLENFTLNTVFQTAQSDSDVTILSAPNLVTTHNKKAVIKAGEKRPVITGTTTDTIGVRSSVDLQDIGIELSFTPLIGSNGVVQLEIEQTIDSVNGTTLIDGNEQPIIGSRSATSYVSVKDEDVIVLGGLQEVENRISEGKMFLLGQIPLLGDWLFSSKKEELQRQDLVIFIRPKVIYNTDDARAIAREVIEKHPTGEQVDSFIEGDGFGDE